MGRVAGAEEWISRTEWTAVEVAEPVFQASSFPSSSPFSSRNKNAPTALAAGAGLFFPSPGPQCSAVGFLEESAPRQFAFASRMQWASLEGQKGPCSDHSLDGGTLERQPFGTSKPPVERGQPRAHTRGSSSRHTHTRAQHQVAAPYRHRSALTERPSAGRFDCSLDPRLATDSHRTSTPIVEYCTCPLRRSC